MVEYHVDEAGDSVLWGRRGEVRIGTEGCSRYFILGMACVKEPDSLAAEADKLRRHILSDPYFKGVPSLDPARCRTALYFHAKDDPNEVRRDFFRLIQQHEIEFHAVVRCKREVLRVVSEFRTMHPNYVYNPNQLYDDLARRLFHDKLHWEDAYSVVFARRGKSDRTRALQVALEEGRRRHCAVLSLVADAAISVRAAHPKDRVALQVVDYFLWAVQRAFEKGEDRYVQLMWPQIHCIWDCDDKREDNEGVRYTEEKPLTAAAILRS